MFIEGMTLEVGVIIRDELLKGEISYTLTSESNIQLVTDREFPLKFTFFGNR